MRHEVLKCSVLAVGVQRKYRVLVHPLGICEARHGCSQQFVSEAVPDANIDCASMLRSNAMPLRYASAAQQAPWADK